MWYCHRYPKLYRAWGTCDTVCFSIVNVPIYQLWAWALWERRTQQHSFIYRPIGLLVYMNIPEPSQCVLEVRVTSPLIGNPKLAGCCPTTLMPALKIPSIIKACTASRFRVYKPSYMYIRETNPCPLTQAGCSTAGQTLLNLLRILRGWPLGYFERLTEVMSKFEHFYEICNNWENSQSYLYEPWIKFPEGLNTKIRKFCKICS